MKQFIFILSICVITLQSCTKDYPIVFSKTTDYDTITLKLFEDKTFSYTAKSSKGIAFNEKGTYSQNDSLLVLDYKHKEYSYNCLTIPLPNDTLLFVKYNEQYILYPIVRENFITKKSFTTERIMNTLVKEYTTPQFYLLIGSKYFTLTEGNINNITNNTYLITKYYDSKIKKN